MCIAHSQHASCVQLQVDQQSDTEQCHLDEVRPQHIGSPMSAQVDARWADQDNEESGNHEQRDTPPALAIKEDDPKGEQQPQKAT